MEQNQIDTKKAIEIVKEYFEKLKGADIPVGGRKLIDWLDFRVLSAKLKDGAFEIICELYETMYSDKREKYTILVSKDGKISEVTKENGST